MNIQAMMAQAKKLQKDIENAAEEINKSTFTYENDNVLVEATGDNKITKVVIKNEDILADKEMAEDIILVAVNGVLDQIKNVKTEKLGKYTNGLGGLF